MSRIYFHAQNEDEAEVSGSERAWMGNLCNSALTMAFGSLFEYSGSPHWLRKLIPADSYILRSTPWDERHVETWLRVSDKRLILDGQPVPLFEIVLNTALTVGGDALRLCARLHGQCEVHAWVDGPNRAWLADMIENGRKSNVLRKDQGWEDVVTLLRARDDAPVVTSYSVCEQFPGYSLRPDGMDLEAWRALDHDERWQKAMDRLRQEGGGLELTPSNWNDYYFGSTEWNGFAISEKYGA